MQIQPETIIWNQPSATSKNVAKALKPDVFRLEPSSEGRTAGSMPVWSQPKTATEDIVSGLESAQKKNDSPVATSLTEDAGKKDGAFGFLDLVDMVNPLQHIPVISTIYRDLTGDTIKPVSRVVGGAAFGGPIGAMAGAVNALFQMETGKDVTDNMVASVENMSAPAISNTASDTTIALTNLRTPQRNYNS